MDSDEDEYTPSTEPMVTGLVPFDLYPYDRIPPVPLSQLDHFFDVQSQKDVVACLTEPGDFAIYVDEAAIHVPLLLVCSRLRRHHAFKIRRTVNGCFHILPEDKTYNAKSIDKLLKIYVALKKIVVDEKTDDEIRLIRPVTSPTKMKDSLVEGKLGLTTLSYYHNNITTSKTYLTDTLTEDGDFLLTGYVQGIRKVELCVLWNREIKRYPLTDDPVYGQILPSKKQLKLVERVQSIDEYLKCFLHQKLPYIDVILKRPIPYKVPKLESDEDAFRNDAPEKPVLESKLSYQLTPNGMPPVPVEFCSYYHGPLPCNEVEPRLNFPGEFLVHTNDAFTNLYVVCSASVNKQLVCYRKEILQTKNGNYYIKEKDAELDLRNIHYLINYYMKSKSPLEKPENDAASSGTFILSRPVSSFAVDENSLIEVERHRPKLSYFYPELQQKDVPSILQNFGDYLIRNDCINLLIICIKGANSIFEVRLPPLMKDGGLGLPLLDPHHPLEFADDVDTYAKALSLRRMCANGGIMLRPVRRKDSGAVSGPQQSPMPYQVDPM